MYNTAQYEFVISGTWNNGVSHIVHSTDKEFTYFHKVWKRADSAPYRAQVPYGK